MMPNLCIVVPMDASLHVFGETPNDKCIYRQICQKHRLTGLLRVFPWACSACGHALSPESVYLLPRFWLCPAHRKMHIARHTSQDGLMPACVPACCLDDLICVGDFCLMLCRVSDVGVSTVHTCLGMPPPGPSVAPACLLSPYSCTHVCYRRTHARMSAAIAVHMHACLLLSPYTCTHVCCYRRTHARMSAAIAVHMHACLLLSPYTCTQAARGPLTLSNVCGSTHECSDAIFMN